MRQGYESGGMDRCDHVLADGTLAQERRACKAAMHRRDTAISRKTACV